MVLFVIEEQFSMEYVDDIRLEHHKAVLYIVLLYILKMGIV